MLIEGVHFRPDDPPDSIGVKALAVNLSDLAAMGAETRAYVEFRLGDRETELGIVDRRFAPHDAGSARGARIAFSAWASVMRVMAGLPAPR